MLIDKLVIPASEMAEVGLQPIEMDRLGRFVALTGKNGAGKSRVLAKLAVCINQRNQYVGNLETTRQNISNLQNTINGNPGHQSKVPWQRQLSEMQRTYTIATERIFPITSPLIGVLHFVPKELGMTDPRQQHQSALKSSFDHAKKPGLDNIQSYCFSYIQLLQNREWEVTHQRATHDHAVIEAAKDEYARLVSLIEILLKAKIGRSIDADATIFNKPLAEAALSDGQKVLIQLAVALHAQNGKLDNTVFLLDEPENHLHPSALIEFLDALEQVAKNSQFWIATHSIPLLAHIANKEPMSIWYVEDGEVTNAGSKPEKVLRGLLGNDEQIDNLNTFTSLPAQYAAISFAADCLTVPRVIGGGSGDPQIAQIGGMLNFDAHLPISLLDYGAGKSRLLSGLAEFAKNAGKNLLDSLSYYAFDTSPIDKADSLVVIESVYGTGQARYFLTPDDFFSSKDDASIDVVVMCNVLHEILPDDWLKLFNEHSLIGRSLKNSGSLLIVEDQRIPTGEKAHRFGFFVLDTPHLRTLFSVKETDDRGGHFQVYDHRGDGRLKAHKISKELLTRLNADNRKRAIEQLRETSKEKIIALRQASPDYRNGQLHGFWTQQFANASLWLEEH